jgi:hypothetical protein
MPCQYFPLRPYSSPLIPPYPLIPHNCCYSFPLRQQRLQRNSLLSAGLQINSNFHGTGVNLGPSCRPGLTKTVGLDFIMLMRFWQLPGKLNFIDSFGHSCSYITLPPRAVVRRHSCDRAQGAWEESRGGSKDPQEGSRKGSGSEKGCESKRRCGLCLRKRKKITIINQSKRLLGGSRGP